MIEVILNTLLASTWEQVGYAIIYTFSCFMLGVIIGGALQRSIYLLRRGA